MLLSLAAHSALIWDCGVGRVEKRFWKKSVMIIGAHSIIYSKNPEAERVFLRDVLQLTNVDVGDGFQEIDLRLRGPSVAAATCQ